MVTRLLELLLGFSELLRWGIGVMYERWKVSLGLQKQEGRSIHFYILFFVFTCYLAICIREVMEEVGQKRSLHETEKEVDEDRTKIKALRLRKRKLPPIQRSLAIILASLQGKD